jgi:hypothetical protein
MCIDDALSSEKKEEPCHRGDLFVTSDATTTEKNDKAQKVPAIRDQTE